MQYLGCLLAVRLGRYHILAETFCRVYRATVPFLFILAMQGLSVVELCCCTVYTNDRDRRAQLYLYIVFVPRFYLLGLQIKKFLYHVLMMDSLRFFNYIIISPSSGRVSLQLFYLIF